MKKQKPIRIDAVKHGSVAKRHGIKPNDYLISINGNVINDVLDYRFYTASAEITLAIKRKEKYFAFTMLGGHDIGLYFADGLMDSQNQCKNKCVFCFIDQLPKGLRSTLYFKDDDDRLSFLQGNYITLTNLTQREIDRIIEMRISPVRVSVHTTNPELRNFMMGNRFAGDTLKLLKKFTQAGIRLECQLVLCPQINDGKELDRTISDLSELMPYIDSVAAVPVGITKYRQGLTELRPYNKDEARQVIKQLQNVAKKMYNEYGTRVFRASDEFYLKAELPFPNLQYYEDFSQLENGVGMWTLFESEFSSALRQSKAKPIKQTAVLATGVAAAPLMKACCKKAKEKWTDLDIEVVAIKNDFFGHTINVSGLVVGADLINQLKGYKADLLLIPGNMLRHEGDLFLDNTTLKEVQDNLNMEINIVGNGGQDLVDALTIPECIGSSHKPTVIFLRK